MFRIFLICLMYFFAFMYLAGCSNPNSPTNCLSEELNATYEKLEGVRAGDPDYAEAVKWSAICPGWGLVSE